MLVLFPETIPRALSPTDEAGQMCSLAGRVTAILRLAVTSGGVERATAAAGTAPENRQGADRAV